MRRTLFILPLFFLLPMVGYAAPSSFRIAQSLVTASSSPGNAYAVGASVVLTAPVAGDFSALGGSVITAAPISGDELILGGSVNARSVVTGDMRALGGHIEVSKPVAGDLVAGGFSVADTSTVGGAVFIVAENTTLAAGATGPVTIYGNNIALAGDFSGDVTIVAWGRVALASTTVIHGALSYEAPEVAYIPDSAKILGGTHYTNASYLPDVGTSRILSLISIGFFVIARIIGALILAGLLAGLFPFFAQTLMGRVMHYRTRSALLSFFLGFAVLVATPIVIALLLLTFVGAGIAGLLLILYALLLTLGLLYGAIILGGLVMRPFRALDVVRWHDGVLGMAILSLVALIPVIGWMVVLAATLVVSGLLLQVFFSFAFPHEEIH